MLYFCEKIRYDYYVEYDFPERSVSVNKELHAYVRHPETKKYGYIIRDRYQTKTEFKHALQRHGYTVVRISTTRDLAAQKYGFETFAAMKKHDSRFRAKTRLNSAYTRAIKTINQIPLYKNKEGNTR